MRTLIFVLLLILMAIPSWAQEVAAPVIPTATPGPDVKRPPFYLMSFYEVQHAFADVRTDYLQRLPGLLKRLKTSDVVSLSQPFAAVEPAVMAESPDRWERLVRDVKGACEGFEANQKVCAELESLRIAQLEKKGRPAPKADHSTSQPTTRPPSK